MIYLISGPTGAGKNSVAEEMAKLLDTAAIVDFDSIRAMFTKPHYTPWDGDEGKKQNNTTIELICQIANTMLAGGRTPIILDVLNNEDAAFYRKLLSEKPQIIQLMPSWETIVERNRTRAEKEGRIRLTDDQLQRVYSEQKNFGDYGQLIENDNHVPSETARQILG
jgi:shikimate kinase